MAVLRDRFSECTVIAITHRLHSIIDFDQVLVMCDGQVLEAGNPRQLLEGGEGVFKALYLQQCGTDAVVSGNLSDYRQS
jgi:ABC-type multidrug transport system fused ATPase/permease subunit